jgi:hypothetical protein
VVFVHCSLTKVQDTLLYSTIEGWQTAPGGVPATSLPDTDSFRCCQAAAEGQSGAPYLGLHLMARSWWPGIVKAHVEEAIQATVSSL